MVTLSAEEKNACMSQERAFLTKLLESALQGEFEKLKTTVDDYCRQHVNVSATDVLTQFRDGTQRTALHFACQSVPTTENEQDIVEKMLLSKWLPAASVQLMMRIKDKDGLTPIMLAAQLDHHTLVEKRITTLLQAGAGGSAASMNPKTHGKLALARSKAGATPLHYAAGAGAIPTTIRTLYEAGQVSIHASSLQGGTPLHWAVALPPPNDYSETIMALLDCGANMNACTSDPTQLVPPPLVMAIAAGNDQHGKFLLLQARQRSIDLSPTVEFSLPGSVTVYHMAADMNMVGTLALLLEDADLHRVMAKQNANGMTPLDLAAKEGHVGCVLLLLPDDENRTEEAAKEYIEKVKANPPVFGSSAATSGSIPKQSDVTENDNAIDTASKTVEEEAMRQASELSAVEVSDEKKSTAKELKAKGNTHFTASNWELALETYSEAISTDPTDATFYSNRSACHLHLKKPKDALGDAVIARHLRPEWPKAAYRMAVARFELGRYEDAAVSAWEGLQQDENNEELKTLLQKCVRKGRKDFHQAKDN
jgi:ankyrin repeat protein